jgi:GNAT superfamily N-acetyltransferase
VTESTEPHALGEEHLPGCLALSTAARWNQNAADWRLMLSMGRGWGLSVAGTLVASTLVLHYGAFAWISMVLVLPEHRRKGYASRLLRIALDHLRDRGVTAILDATPAGREVYRQEGFHDTWTFRRYHLKSGIGRAFAPERKREPDFRLDREAFGADRTSLLTALQRRLPRAALGSGEAFVLGREGREAHQLGPLVARDEDTAIGLLEAALGTVEPPVYLDAVDHAPRLRRWLEERGCEFQRPFTRMVHGGARAPGNEKLVYLVAGPELG